VSEIILGDCLEVMRGMADNQFDLVLTDPPYGLWGKEPHGRVGGRKLKGVRHEWDKFTPDKEYFDEMRRVSKQQIIWGANYFNCFNGGGAIVWDKLQPLPSVSQYEIASISGYQ
jgi:site-specific DNA-methyltransferase (adenine-specific)